MCDAEFEAAEVLCDTAVPVAGTAGDSADDDGVPMLMDVALLRPHNAIRWDPRATRTHDPQRSRRAQFMDGHITWSHLSQLKDGMAVHCVGASTGGHDDTTHAHPTIAWHLVSTHERLVVCEAILDARPP